MLSPRQVAIPAGPVEAILAFLYFHIILIYIYIGPYIQAFRYIYIYTYIYGPLHPGVSGLKVHDAFRVYAFRRAQGMEKKVILGIQGSRPSSPEPFATSEVHVSGRRACWWQTSCEVALEW